MSGMETPNGGEFRQLDSLYEVLRKSEDSLAKYKQAVHIARPIYYEAYINKISMGSGNRSFEPEARNKEDIPFDDGDEILTGFLYKVQVLPPDPSTYIPAYVSSVTDPSHFYIQNIGKSSEITVTLKKLTEDLKDFYDGYQLERYILKEYQYLRLRACCIAKWPVDNYWYRAQILSYCTLEEAFVRYIDFGNTHWVHKSLIRPLVKRFADLPAQALRCRLAFIKPYSENDLWHGGARECLLKWTKDLCVMAKIMKLEDDGVHSITLHDIRHGNILINDKLCVEGFAECTAPLSMNNAVTSTQSNNLTRIPKRKTKEELKYEETCSALASMQIDIARGASAPGQHVYSVVQTNGTNPSSNAYPAAASTSAAYRTTMPGPVVSSDAHQRSRRFQGIS